MILWLCEIAPTLKNDSDKNHSLPYTVWLVAVLWVIQAVIINKLARAGAMVIQKLC